MDRRVDDRLLQVLHLGRNAELLEMGVKVVVVVLRRLDIAIGRACEEVFADLYAMLEQILDRFTKRVTEGRVGPGKFHVGSVIACQRVDHLVDKDANAVLIKRWDKMTIGLQIANAGNCVMVLALKTSHNPVHKVLVLERCTIRVEQDEIVKRQLLERVLALGVGLTSLHILVDPADRLLRTIRSAEGGVALFDQLLLRTWREVG
jgi:hypothetical protein